MTTVDKIRSGLIDKILTIKNKDFLEKALAAACFINTDPSEACHHAS